MTTTQPTPAPADYVREMNIETLNAHTEFQISVQQAIGRLQWRLDQIVMRAECARRAAQAPQIAP